MRGIPPGKEKFKEVVGDFFSETVINSFEKNVVELKYRNLRKLVKFYNTKVKKK